MLYKIKTQNIESIVLYKSIGDRTGVNHKSQNNMGYIVEANGIWHYKRGDESLVNNLCLNTIEGWT